MFNKMILTGTNQYLISDRSGTYSTLQTVLIKGNTFVIYLPNST